MENFEFAGKVYTFDSNLWDSVDLNNPSDYHTECPKTIKYIGPIIDGSIVGSVPKFPVYVGTFCGLTELVHLPKGLPKYYVFDAFMGCCNLNPTVDELKEFANQTGSGYGDPNIFGECNSPHIIDLSKKQVSVIETLSIIFNKSTDVVTNVLQDYGVKVIDFYTEIKPTASWALRDIELKLLMHCFKVFNQCEPLKFSTGAAIDFKEVSKSSELEHKAQTVYENYAMSCRFSQLRISDDPVTCYKLSDDFIVDSDDQLLIKHFGRVLNSTVLNTPYIAGENGTIETYGDSTIEVAGDCPIQASGTLTIRGSGILHVTCKDNQQACIGTQTHTGMSYDRWEPGRDAPLDEIVIDGVSVICVSAVPNFSIGSYGTNQMPKITYKDGGRLLCPETEGSRIMVKSGVEDLCGSTKRNSNALYSIAPGAPFSTESINDASDDSVPKRMDF